MDKVKLSELINKLVKEYSGHHTMKNASPRPFSDDVEELENYMYKSIYGGDGGHYKNYVKTGNYNSLNKQGMFELKKYIKKLIKEQAYGSATLTTQGSPRTGTVVPTDEYPFSARPKRTATGMYENEGELADLKDQLANLYQEMEEEIIKAGEHIKGGGPVTDYYADPIEKLEKEIRALEGDSIEGGPSYDEVYLKSKLVGMTDAYEYDPDRGIVIFPDLGSLQYRSRSTQEITFTKHKGEIHFVHAFGYEATYYKLKEVFPELPPMGRSSYSGFFNVHSDRGTIPVDLDTAKAMIDAMKKGRDAEAKSQSDFYTRQPGTGGTGIDEINEQEGPDPAQKAFESGLKRLQKGVIQFQLRFIEKQKSKAMAQSATSAAEAGQGFEDQIQALKDQISAIDNPEKEQSEGLLESYINSRKDTNLMTCIDTYKQTILLEGTMKKFFEMFDGGKTNEEVFKHYAKRGITIPEQFLAKARKQYEGLKKAKLEIEFAEQEAKDIITPPVKVPDIVTFNMGDDKKKLASSIYQEKK